MKFGIKKYRDNKEIDEHEEDQMESEDCYGNAIQDFLICTTVHKARNLNVFTGDVFVRVSLGKVHKSSKTFSKSENPYFNEYFVFELKCTLAELLRLTILYEVRKRTACKKDMVLGELLIDLQSIWNQPNRCFFKKWGRLECPMGGSPTSAEQGKGYLQIDLAIVSQATNINALHSGVGGNGVGNVPALGAGGDVSMAGAGGDGAAAGLNVEGLSHWKLNTDYDDINKNLLQNIDAATKCNIRYSIYFHKGFFVKKGDYMIQFRFPPFKGKTPVSKNTTIPAWSYEFSFAANYPSMAQTLLVQVMIHEHLQWKSVGEFELHFEEIAFKETSKMNFEIIQNIDLPVLGPTFIHLYDSQHPTQYIGRVLLEIRSETLIAEISRDLSSKSVQPIEEQRWWQTETFVVEFLTLRGDFLHGNLSNIKISLKIAENTSSNVECYLKSYHTKMKSGKLLKYFEQDTPFKSIFLKAVLPDNRYKFESDTFMQEILDFMKTEIETFKLFQLKYTNQHQLQIKCFKALIMTVLNKIKEGVAEQRLKYDGFKEPTKWDSNRFAFLQEYFKKLPDELHNMRQKLKSNNGVNIETIIEDVLQDLLKCTQDLTGILTMARVQDQWPDLYIVLSSSNNKDFAYCKLNAKYFMQSPRDQSTQNKVSSPTNMCWRMRNFVFKDSQCTHTCYNCGCYIGILHGCLGIIVENQRMEFFTTIAQDWKQVENFYFNPLIPFTTFKCRLFIHQAKIRPGSDSSGLCDAHLRIIFASQSAETPVEPATLSPIWNVVICFECVALAGSVHWYTKYPPLIAVEMYDADERNVEQYLGSGVLSVSVISADKLHAQGDEAMEGREQLGRFLKTKMALQKFQQLKTLSPPPLKWIPIAISGAVRAEVLMAAELVEIENQGCQRPTIPPTVTSGIPSNIRPIMRNFVLEVIFAGFRNYTKSGRHRVKIMMGDLILTSGLSSSRIRNSVNFLVLYASGVVSLPEQLEYWPAIIATDVLVSARGAETTVGAVLIANSKRYLQREEVIQCRPMESDAVSTIASTVVYMDDNEESPLIGKTESKATLYQRLRGALSRNKSEEQKQLEEKKRKDEEKKRRNQQQSKKVERRPSTLIEYDCTWWTKFYNSLQADTNESEQSIKHRLIVYPNELEKQAEFSYLQDWAEPVKLVHGVKYKKNALPQEETYATLKLKIKITPCQCTNNCGLDGGGDGVMLKPLTAALNPRYQSQLQVLAEICNILVRVYIVQGIQFRSHDKHSQSDSYVKLQLGNKITSNRAHYVPNQSNPIFGKYFQMEAVLPREHILEVSVFDRNALSDEVIGTTYIDLEDRWRSKHRATVGIPLEYSKLGYNKWRDIASPYETLCELCKKFDKKEPTFTEDSIEIDGMEFEDDSKIATNEDIRERLSLVALKNFQKLPSFGYKLVPEHVETRPLYRNDCPGIEQGKIQLWIELYEGNLNIPPAIDITPQPPQIYELRVIVWNCADVVMDEKNVFGTKMSDIYVKGWCQDSEYAQSTDIHYRSLNGEGNFNWRMIFPIKYSTIEDMMVVKRKGGILEEYETKQPPILCLQIWDDDLISHDDFLGSLELNLSNLLEPFETAKTCVLPDEPSKKFGKKKNVERDSINLFRKKKIKGWFPMRGSIPKRKNIKKKFEQAALAAKIELELEIISEAEASVSPAGLGREEPNALPLPVRPDTSFNPFLHPWKGLTKILLPALKRKMIYCLLIFSLVILGVYFFPSIQTIILK